MGTRAIIHVKSEGRKSPTLTTIYRQMDGYPDGLGNDIRDALKSREVVNGINDRSKQVNGMGCAAAMLISALKGDEAGSVYIYAPDTDGLWEEYTYTLWADGHDLFIECNDGDVSYSGKLDEFDGAKVEAGLTFPA